MRSEEWIPADIRRILAHPRFLHFAACAGLMLLVLACFWGIRRLANRRLEPIVMGRVFSARELVEVERALIRAGLSDYRIENGQILAPIGLRSRYREALVEHGASLWKAPGHVMYEALAESTFLETPEQQRMRLRVAGEREMSLILSQIEGIDDAAVRYDEATIGGLHPTKEITAMVAIRPSAGTVIDGKMLVSIRDAVAAYKAGLDPADVTIVNLKTAETGVVSADAAAQAHAERKADLERAWQSEVARVLRFIPQVEIETNVDLRTNRETPLTAAVVRSLEPSRIVVSIGIPIGYYRELWNQRTTDADAKASGPTSAELSEIERKTRADVESLIAGLATGHAAQKPDIQVMLFQQVDRNGIDVARNDSPFLTWMRSHLNQIVQATVVLLAIALVVGVFRDLFYEDDPRSVAEDRPDQDLRVYAPANKQQSADCDSDIQDTTPAQNDTFVQADLTELVREHPQAVSAMLQSWVKEAR